MATPLSPPAACCTMSTVSPAPAPAGGRRGSSSTGTTPGGFCGGAGVGGWGAGGRWGAGGVRRAWIDWHKVPCCGILLRCRVGLSRCGVLLRCTVAVHCCGVCLLRCTVAVSCCRHRIRVLCGSSPGFRPAPTRPGPAHISRPFFSARVSRPLFPARISRPLFPGPVRCRSPSPQTPPSRKIRKGRSGRSGGAGWAGGAGQADGWRGWVGWVCVWGADGCVWGGRAWRQATKA
jgi:hypothetical protein